MANIKHGPVARREVTSALRPERGEPDVDEIYQMLGKALRHSLVPTPPRYAELRAALPKFVELVADLHEQGRLPADLAEELIRVFAARVFERHIAERFAEMFGEGFPKSASAFFSLSTSDV